MYRSQVLLSALILILGLRITSYFTLFPDSVAMTQLMKTGLRICLTFTAFLLLKSLRDKYKDYRFSFDNLTPLLLYCCYLFLGLISLFWSAIPYYSMLQWAMVVEALAFAWAFSMLLAYYNKLSDNHARFSLLFGRSVLWISIGFLIGLAIDPETFYRQTHGGEVSRLGGIIINPNELGMLAVLGIVMGYAELLDKRPKGINILVILASVAVLLLSQSRSSLGAFLLVTAIFILRLGNMKVIFLSIVAAIVVMPILINTIIVKAGDLEEVMSLTDRLPFWKDLLTDGFTKRPFLGHGFMCISEGDYFHSIHAYSAKMTHNTFIQVLLNLGLVGAFVCFLQMVAAFISIITSLDKNTKWLAGMMLVPLLINSLTEFGIFGESNYGIQFYQLLILFFVIEVKPSTSAQGIPAKAHFFQAQTI